MLSLILNDDHLAGALGRALASCRHRLFIATADVKDLHIPVACTDAADVAARGQRTRRPARRGRARSIVKVFHELSRRGVEVRLLHAGVPSGPFLGSLKDEGVPTTLTMRRCPRVHIKAVVADGQWMYLGSANLTGAGLGAKSARRRNFEGGIWTDDLAVIDPVVDMLDEIWSGAHCDDCGRSEHCPEPLEEPDL